MTTPGDGWDRFESRHIGPSPTEREAMLALVRAPSLEALAEEIIPVTVTDRKGSTVIDTDEHPRADTTVEALAKLKPVLLNQDPEATVTAGNSSGQNDAASMCLVTTPEQAAELGLTPLVRLASWGVAGVPPNVMGIGPVPATEVALRNAGLTHNIMIDAADAAEVTRAKEAERALFERVLGLEGSISGEHGIGFAKQPYVGLELSPDTIALMTRVKAAFDPHGILNPGKIFP